VARAAESSVMPERQDRELDARLPIAMADRALTIGEKYHVWFFCARATEAGSRGPSALGRFGGHLGRAGNSFLLAAHLPAAANLPLGRRTPERLFFSG
jgi:hypothetical protein